MKKVDRIRPFKGKFDQIWPIWRQIRPYMDLWLKNENCCLKYAIFTNLGNIWPIFIEFDFFGLIPNYFHLISKFVRP